MFLIPTVMLLASISAPSPLLGDLVVREYSATSDVPFAAGKTYTPASRVVLTELETAIEVTRMAVGRLDYFDHETTFVEYRITNASKTRKLDYQTPNRALSPHDTALGDEHKNKYKWIRIEVAGITESQSIYPGQSLTDSILFEMPVAAAGRLRFQFPLSIIRAGEKRCISFDLEVRTALAELASNREKAKQAGADARKRLIFRGLPWGMTLADVRAVWPSLKRDDDRAYFAFDVKVADGLPVADIDVAFDDTDHLAKVRMKFKRELSDKEVAMVFGPDVGKPEINERGNQNWSIGKTNLWTDGKDFTGSSASSP